MLFYFPLLSNRRVWVFCLNCTPMRRAVDPACGMASGAWDEDACNSSDDASEACVVAVDAQEPGEP